MQREIDKIVKSLSALNRENSAEDIAQYLKAEEFAQEYAPLIAVINQTIETGVSRIHQERNNLEMINEIIRSGMWSMSFDEEGRMTKVAWSQAFRNMLGFADLQEFPDRLESWSDRLHPKDREETMNAYWATIAGKGKYNVEYRMLTKKEGYKWFCATGEVARRDDGTPALFIGTFVDISQKKENERLMREKELAQEALINQRKDMEETLEGARVGIWSIEREEGCAPRLYGDKMMRILLGVNEEISAEECYKGWIERIEPGYVEMVEKGFQEIIETGRTEVIYPWNHPKWGRIYIRSGGVPDRRFQKKGHKLKGYHQDITETMEIRQRQDKALLDALVETKRANLAKTEFLSHMSHDIRTPINGILGMVSICERNPDDFQRQKEGRTKVRAAAEHLLSLINDVLDVSKLESGSFRFEKEPFSLETVLHSSLEILSPQAEEQKITLESGCFDVVHVGLIGSPLHLRQILINILGNAIKYNRPKGKVILRVKELPQQETEEQALFQFEIEDNGLGISKEFQKHLFEPFTQENSDARTSYKGSGLGMTITRNLVEQMGGKISVESEQGKGSKFTVLLPLSINTAGADAKPPKQELEPISLSGLRVLLVEDNEMNREIAEYFLKDAGMTVVSAENGKAATELFGKSREQEFDCILMDIMMPVMNGLEAVAHIRRMEREDAKTVPIIALSANAFEEDMQKSKDVGINEHLAKPLNFEKLFQVMAVYCKGRKPKAI